MIPGRALSIALTLLGVSVVVLLPIAAIFTAMSGVTPASFWTAISTPRDAAAFRLTFGASFAAALIDVVLGFLIAWVTVRYRFVGRELINAAIDLPFALPPPVSGIAPATLYSSSGWMGAIAGRLRWALIDGILLCAARSVGEFGAVAVVSGNIQGVTETLPLRIGAQYDEYQITAAFATASLLAFFAVIVGAGRYVVRRHVEQRWDENPVSSPG